MENANKFKVVRDITVLDCSTPYMFEKTKKYISNKYKGLGIADDAMLSKLWEGININYNQFIYPTVVDFELTKYDTETVKAAFEELGVLFGKATNNEGVNINIFYLKKKIDQIPVFIGGGNTQMDYYSLEILANYNSSSGKGTSLYTSFGWIAESKDEEVAVNTLQKGKPFLWSFINWVKGYVAKNLSYSLFHIQSINSKLNKGMPAATTTEKGAVKMAGKVDALADSATLAQAVERLNTLIAQLKSAGIMSEN